MAIIGFNFTTMHVERKAAAKGKIDISNNTSIINVEETKVAIGGASQKTLRISFEYSVEYKPKAGNMKFTGDVLFLEDAKAVDEVTASWKKNKSLPKRVAAGVVNTILNRCNVQALILSQQVNLPSPIPMPKVSLEKKQ